MLLDGAAALMLLQHESVGVGVGEGEACTESVQRARDIKVCM